MRGRSLECEAVFKSLRIFQQKDNWWGKYIWPGRSNGLTFISGLVCWDSVKSATEPECLYPGKYFIPAIKYKFYSVFVVRFNRKSQHFPLCLNLKSQINFELCTLLQSRSSKLLLLYAFIRETGPQTVDTSQAGPWLDFLKNRFSPRIAQQLLRGDGEGGFM